MWRQQRVACWSGLKCGLKCVMWLEEASGADRFRREGRPEEIVTTFGRHGHMDMYEGDYDAAHGVVTDVII